MTSASSNRLLLLAAALLFSTGGAAIKATALTSWQVACFRPAVAAAALYLLLPAARRSWNRRMFPVGLAYAVMLVLFVLANKLTTSANSIFLQSTAPLYVLLLGPWLLSERVRRSDVLLIAMVGIGMSLFFIGQEAPAATAPDPFTGNVLAALSGVTWAFTVIGLRWMGSRGAGMEGPATLVAGNLLACAISLPFALPVEQASAADAAIIVYLGVFQIGLAYVCMTRALRQVPAFEATTLLLAEPALNPVWTWLAHGEKPGPWAIAGGAMILAATLANTWWQSRDPAKR